MASRTRAFVIALTLGVGLGVATGVFSTGGTARADTLLIDDVNAARPTASERPARGSSMTTVEARFGAPTTRSAAVGKPPITRWDYPDFAVYFEYDHVLHSVRR